MSVHSHPVHIYRDAHEMERGVGEWLAASLRAGSGAIAICTEEHARAVRTQLAALGVDAAGAENEGRLAILDADALLARFMLDGMPNGAAFKRIVRALVAQVQARSGPGTIRAWGEMVDILAKQSQPDAAHLLESLWNEILAETDAQLLCSYRLDGLAPDLYARVLADVCTTHSEVIASDASRLDAAVASALGDVFGKEDGATLQRILPTRADLLGRMARGVAVIVSLRGLDPRLGELVAQRAEEHLQRLPAS